MDNFDKAIDLIKNSNYVVAFTGAGISVESGIPPFRGKNGLWNKYNPVFLDTFYFKNHPKESWKLIKEIFYDFFGKAKPNKAHYVLAEWEQKNIIKSIITQNIDNLHQEAGSKNVIEFHGTSRYLTCMDCGEKFKVNQELLFELPPKCKRCGGLLKPDFVFFSEPIPEKALNKSVIESSRCDLMILIGTSGEIMPASQIPFMAKQKGAKILEINLTESNYTHSVTDLFLKGKATVIMTRLNEKL